MSQINYIPDQDGDRPILEFVFPILPAPPTVAVVVTDKAGGGNVALTAGTGSFAGNDGNLFLYDTADITGVNLETVAFAQLSVRATATYGSGRTSILRHTLVVRGARASLDALISSRATQAQILSDATPFAGADVAAIFSDTAAIDARLPPDPADASDLLALHNATQAAIAALENLSQAQAQAACDAALLALGYTAPRAASLDNLDELVSAPKSLVANAVNTTTLQDNTITDAKVATDLDTYQAEVSLVDDDNASFDRYTVAFLRNGQPIFAGVTVPTLTVYDAGGVDLFTTQVLSAIPGKGTFQFNTAASRVVSGTAYRARVTATIDGSPRDWDKGIGRDSA